MSSIHGKGHSALRSLPFLSHTMDPEIIVSDHANVISLLLKVLNLTNEQSTAFIVIFCQWVARHVQLLPSSKFNHDHQTAGAFRHTLLTTIVTARLLQSNTDAEQWRDNAFKLAGVAAALSHDLGKPQTDMLILTNSGIFQGEQPLYDYLISNDTKIFPVAWRNSRSKSEHDRLSHVFTKKLINLSPTPVRSNILECYENTECRIKILAVLKLADGIASQLSSVTGGLHWMSNALVIDSLTQLSIGLKTKQIDVFQHWSGAYVSFESLIPTLKSGLSTPHKQMPHSNIFRALTSAGMLSPHIKNGYVWEMPMENGEIRKLIRLQHPQLISLMSPHQ